MNSTDESGSSKERRVHIHLRVIFESACHITMPFLDKKQGFDGMPMKVSALRALHNNFPDLSEQDIALLFSAVQNFHGVRSAG